MHRYKVIKIGSLGTDNSSKFNMLFIHLLLRNPLPRDPGIAPNHPPRALRPNRCTIQREVVGGAKSIIRTNKTIIRTVRENKIKGNPTTTKVTIKVNRFPRRKESQTNDYSTVPVGGRLVRFRKSWVKSYHYKLVAQGLSWKWLNNTPPPLFQPTHWHQDTSPEMDRDLTKLSRKKVIEKVRFNKFTCRLFSVPKKNSTENRTILDLSPLNQYIHLTSFKMLTLKEVRLQLPPDAWTISIDLKDGFWHLSVARAFRPYLGFKYRGQNWRFRAMPFGLNLAPLTFTKLIRFVVHRLAEENIWCLPYLDDLLIIALSRQECLLKMEKTLEILQSLGWIINTEKSRLTPQQAFEWLGIQYNLKSYRVQNSPSQCQKFNSQLEMISTQRWFTKRDLMGIQGIANWLGQVDPLRRTVFSQSRPLLRALRRVKNNTKLTLDNRLRICMARWLHLPNNSVPLGIPEPHITIQTDASKTGIGFTVNHTCYQLILDESMKLYSINILELLAVWMASLKVKDRNVIIRILTDNSTALSAIKRASSTTYQLASIAEMIWKRASKMNWTLSVVHIKGTFNVLADQLSRNTAISTEWSLPKEVFRREVLALEPRLEVDLFATNLNHQLETYISPCPDPRAAGINALVTNWGQWNHGYIFPPRPMILKALQKMKQSNIKTALFLTVESQEQAFIKPLKSQLSLESTFKVKLQQVVASRLVKDKRISTVHVWRFSREQTA